MKGWWKTAIRYGCGLNMVLAAPTVLNGESIDAVQKAATEWARVRSETVRAETEWRWQKVFLESTLESLAERSQVLKDRRDFLEATVARERGNASELGLKNREALELLQDAGIRAQALSARLVDLRPWLPPRLSEALEFSYRSLEDASLGISERMQAVTIVFNRCFKFDRAITYSEEMLVVKDGKPARFLSVIYWGLSHAYALDATDGIAFFGSPGEKEWIWEEKAGLGPTVARLMALYHDEATPEFTEAPARLVNPIGASDLE